MKRASAPEYRRNLPHIESRGKPVFVTFCSKDRWVLPESVRRQVLEHCLHDDGKKIDVHAIVVMPDHVHMIYTPLTTSEGTTVPLAEILNGIKGASAHSINRILNRKGPVWQPESFDRLLRSDEKLQEKGEYICQNPVRKKLVSHENEYPWLWREWREGLAREINAHTAGGGCTPDTPGTAEGGCAPDTPGTAEGGCAPKQPRAAALQELGIPPHRLPRHIAIIMDGNGRWAKKRGQARVSGHEAGAENVREIVTHAARLGIQCLTLYSFSTENWNRPFDEIAHLMRLYVKYLIKERPEIMDNDIRMVQIGRRVGLPDEVLRELDQTATMSADNKGMTLCLALNYSSRVELVDAIQKIAAHAAAGRQKVESIDEATVNGSLYTAGLPDPDLLIRTAGEMRVSNFLLWQISYAEIYVTPVLWPDFHKADLNAAIQEYARRDRRFGAL